MGMLLAQPEPQDAGSPAPLLAVADGPEKPPCAMCGHIWADHGVTVCSGRTSSISLDCNGHCLCRRHVDPQEGR